MPTVLVTGATGFVGIALCRQLQAAGYTVYGVDNLFTGSERRARLPESVQFAAIDVTDATRLHAHFSEVRPEIVVHLAALHFIPDCNRRPVDAVWHNVVGTQSVLECVRAVSGVRRIILASSAAVYPVSDRFMRETEEPAPDDVYGVSKATNERQAKALADATGIQTIAVRLFNVYGPGETNPHVIPEIVRQVASGCVSIFLGNITPKRCYIYIDEVAEGFHRLIECPVHTPFTSVNLGSEAEVSVEEVVAVVEGLAGLRLDIRRDSEKWRASDRPFLRCDASLLRSLTGWSPVMPMREGLRTLLESEGVRLVASGIALP